MMCNPNPNYFTRPSGSNPSGSPTGRQPQITNPFLCGHQELLEKSCRAIHRKIPQLRDQWLRDELRARGMPETLSDADNLRNSPEIRALAMRWLHARRFAWGARQANEIILFQNGEEVARATLFKTPNPWVTYDEASPSYRTEFF